MVPFMGVKIICENRKARFDYELLDKYEAGIALLGSEVKSLRDGKANLGDAYASIKGGEVYLQNAHISAYQTVAHIEYDPLRMRKLLLKKPEILKLIGKIQERGFTLVPLKLYFKEGRVKVELALAKSKKSGDKRATIQKRETDRQLRRVMKQSKR